MVTTKTDATIDLGDLWRELNAARDDLEEARRMTDRSEALRASAQRRISRVLSKLEDAR